MTAITYLGKLSKLQLTVLSFVAIALLGIVDYFTGFEISFSIFYLLPISFVAWFGGRKFGIYAAVAGSIVWFLADLNSGHTYPSVAIPYWNATVRLGFFLIIVFLSTYIKSLNELLEAKVQERTALLTQEIEVRKRSEEEARQRAEESDVLFEIVRDLTVKSDLPTLLRTIVYSAAGLLGTSHGALYLFYAGRNVLELSVATTDAPLEGTLLHLGEGACGRAAQTRLPVIVNDYESWEHRLPQMQGIPITAMLAVPMLSGGELIGVLTVSQPEKCGRVFSEANVRLLSLFASHAATAVSSTRQLENAERHLQQIKSLREIDMAITGSLDLRVTLNVFLDQLVSQLEVDAADILLMDSYRQMLSYASGRGFRGKALQHTHLRVGEGHAGKAALERSIISVPNLNENPNHLTRAPLLAGEGFVAYFAMPLVAKGHVKGVLEIFHRAPLETDQEWIDWLEMLAAQAAIAIDTAGLFSDLERSNIELMLAYDTTLEGWSRALDLRDKETEGHTSRVTEMTIELARQMGMKQTELVHVRRGALLHDIGKMGIPDAILHKAGPLTDAEWDVMRKHPELAHEMLLPIAYLHPALDIPYCHHEKWDGTGYPRGLQAEQIPLAARIFAVVDVWDSLRWDRPYRTAWSKEKIREYLQEHSGKHFDPKVVEAFLALEHSVEE
jgi:putative nucleotidyltransferase with HDIG domain